MMRTINPRLALLAIVFALAACASNGLYEPVYDDGLYGAAEQPAPPEETPAS